MFLLPSVLVVKLLTLYLPQALGLWYLLPQALDVHWLLDMHWLLDVHWLLCSGAGDGIPGQGCLHLFLVHVVYSRLQRQHNLKHITLSDSTGGRKEREVEMDNLWSSTHI